MPSLIHRIHPVLYQLLLSIMSGRRPRRSITGGSRTCRSQGSTYGTDHAFWQRLHRVPSDVAWEIPLDECWTAYTGETNVMDTY